jgi:hypothetical protein
MEYHTRSATPTSTVHHPSPAREEVDARQFFFHVQLHPKLGIPTELDLAPVSLPMATTARSTRKPPLIRAGSPRLCIPEMAPIPSLSPADNTLCIPKHFCQSLVPPISFSILCSAGSRWVTGNLTCTIHPPVTPLLIPIMDSIQSRSPWQATLHHLLQNPNPRDRC